MPNEKFHPYLQLNPPEIPQGIPNNDEFLIVCLGGSTTAWADEKNQKWPKQAEINLNKAIPGHNFRVLNQGKEWYTSQHSLINYEINIRFLKPDLVIIMHSINDFMQNADHSYYSNGEFRRDYGHAMGPFTRLFRIRPLFVQIKHVFNSIWYAKTQEEITTDTFPGLVSMEENLNRLIQLISLDGSSTILQTQPYLYKENMNKAEISSIWMHRANGVGKDKKWSIETARKGMIQYNNCIRRIAEEKNIPLIDLEAKVPKTLEYFTDDCHYKSPAIQIISREVSQTIVDLIKEKELSVSN
ncbi:MAG: SGNH/GDSL hydrolase family protein [Bacteroidetes bacterium]|nr:SGNH/GDSL hydrolase family protein [Bacteroidota bacterium]